MLLLLHDPHFHDFESKIFFKMILNLCGKKIVTPRKIVLHEHSNKIHLKTRTCLGAKNMELTAL